MANIVITDDTNFLYIVYNDVAAYSTARKIRKLSWFETDYLAGDDGVEIDIPNDGIILKSDDVDSVNAITDLDTSLKLYNAIKDLM